MARTGVRAGKAIVAVFAILALPAAAEPLLVAVPAAAAPAPADGPAPVAAAPEQSEFAIIDAAIADGRLNAAAEIIGRAAARADSPALRLRVAELALARGTLADAATAFMALVAPGAGGVAAEPAIVAQAQQGLGLVRLRQNDLAAATAALDAALAIDPALVRAWTARGIIADKTRDFATANAAYGKALALAPESAVVLTNQGYSLLLQGRHAEAEAQMARAVVIDPNLVAAQTNLRLARALQGRYKEAFAGATPDRLAAALNTVGFAAMVRGDYATAETYFNRALSQNSRFDSVAWANLRYLKDITHPMDPAAETPPAH